MFNQYADLILLIATIVEILTIVLIVILLQEVKVLKKTNAIMIKILKKLNVVLIILFQF